jgi:hypothetical protein
MIALGVDVEIVTFKGGVNGSGESGVMTGSSPTLQYTGIIKVNQTGTVIKALSSAPGSHRSDVVVSYREHPSLLNHQYPSLLLMGSWKV